MESAGPPRQPHRGYSAVLLVGQAEVRLGALCGRGVGRTKRRDRGGSGVAVALCCVRVARTVRPKAENELAGHGPGCIVDLEGQAHEPAWRNVLLFPPLNSTLYKPATKYACHHICGPLILALLHLAVTLYVPLCLDLQSSCTPCTILLSNCAAPPHPAVALYTTAVSPSRPLHLCLEAFCEHYSLNTSAFTPSTILAPRPPHSCRRHFRHHLYCAASSTP